MILHRLLVSFVIFGVFSDATVVVQTDKQVITDTADDSSFHLIYIKDTVGLLQVASSNYGITGDFSQGSNAIAVDYHYPRNLLFWSTSKGEIFSSALKELRSFAHVEDVKLVYNETRWYPISIAVDYVNDKLYVLDSKSNSMRLLSLDGRDQVVMAVGRRNYRPKQIEIDADKGYLFLLDEGEPSSGRYAHVVRMRLDGSEAKVIDPPPVNLELITGAMTLDRIRGRVLLSSRSQRKILAADYNGKLIDTVLEAQNGTLGMSLSGDELFWINAAYYHNGAEFTDGSVYKCDLDKSSGNCLANSSRKLHDSFGSGYFRVVRGISPLPQISDPQVSKCSSKCEHLCLGSTCTCKLGWSGSEACKAVDDFIVYEDHRVVRSVCLPEEGNKKCNAFVPFEAEMRLKKRERTGFEYDSSTRQLYYGGKNAIYRADVDTGNSSILLYQRSVFFGPMALDWMTKNLYYTEIEQRGNVSFYILKALSARSGVDAEKSSSMLWELGKIHTIALCPWRGYVFLSVYHNGLKRFQMRRLNADALNMTVLQGLNDTTFFSIDHPDEKLYSINVNTSMIVRSDLNGRNAENLSLVEKPDNVTGFLVHDRFIYLKYRARLIKLDKETGKLVGEADLEPYDNDMSMNLKVHSRKTFGIYDRNPCALENGGCDNFCFAIPDKDGKSLRKLCRCFDGVRCFGDTRSGLNLTEVVKNKE